MRRRHHPVLASEPRRPGAGHRSSPLRKRLRDLFAGLADPDLWLRACAIATLRRRDGSPFEAKDLPSHFGNRGPDGSPGTPDPPSIGGRDAPLPTIPPAAIHSPGTALVALSGRGCPPRTPSERPPRPVGARLGRAETQAHSPAADARLAREWPALSSARALASRLELWTCLLAASWMSRAARGLALAGLLDRQGMLTTIRLRSRLSRRAWAIWRSQHSRRSAGREEPPWRRSSK
jgi:hypothetical protein